MAAFDQQETFSKVQAIIADKLKISDVSSITPESTLQDLGADSLDMADIILKMEEQFGIEINDEDAEGLRNVRDVADYVHKLRSR